MLLSLHLSRRYLTVEYQQIPYLDHLSPEMTEVKKTSVGRVESFKTSLTKQKQRLAKQTQVVERIALAF